MSSIYYGQLTVSLFGQSHAPGIGVTVDGLVITTVSYRLEKVQ